MRGGPQMNPSMATIASLTMLKNPSTLHVLLHVESCMGRSVVWGRKEVGESECDARSHDAGLPCGCARSRGFALSFCLRVSAASREAARLAPSAPAIAQRRAGFSRGPYRALSRSHRLRRLHVRAAPRSIQSGSTGFAFACARAIVAGDAVVVNPSIGILLSEARETGRLAARPRAPASGRGCSVRRRGALVALASEALRTRNRLCSSMTERVAVP